MEITSKNIAVVHLVYVPFGLTYFDDFVTSYKNFDAGVPHRLFIVFKGFKSKDEINQFIELANQQELSFEILLYEKSGFDIDAYKWTAGEINTDYILFVNTKTRILAADYLKDYWEAVKANPRSVIGASASYQSYSSSVFQKNKWYWETNKTVKQNFDKYKLIIKAGTLWRFYFKPFPNPHLRTNAFLIKRELFLSLQFPSIKNKLDAYRFESGRNGFTAQLIKKGYAVLLLDKVGKIYLANEWASSKTFWQASQENLLIADNQTDAYEQGDSSEKEMLSFLAWGKK